jgi:uncharacterized MnhB-related membrane protein
MKNLFALGLSIIWILLAFLFLYKNDTLYALIALSTASICIALIDDKQTT